MRGSGQGPHLGTASPSSGCCQSSDIFSLWPLRGGEASLLKVTLLSADPQPLTGQQGWGGADKGRAPFTVTRKELSVVARRGQHCACTTTPIFSLGSLAPSPPTPSVGPQGEP